MIVVSLAREGLARGYDVPQPKRQRVTRWNGTRLVDAEFVSPGPYRICPRDA